MKYRMLSMNVPPGDADCIKAKAQAAGLTIGDYMRRAISKESGIELTPLRKRSPNGMRRLSDGRVFKVQG